jgi:PAS domain S-box-containing protein
MAPYSIDTIKSEVINKALVISATIGSIGYFTSLIYRYLNTSFNISIIFETFVLISLVVVSYKRASITNNTKAFITILLITILSLSDAYFYGLTSTARVYLILVPFFSIIYFSIKRTVMIIIGIITSFIAIGYFHHIGVLTTQAGYEPNAYNLRFYPWIINALHITAVGMVIFIITKKYFKAFSDLITDLKEKNNLISEKERNYREIFNSTNEAIFIHNIHDGLITDVNDVMPTMYGYDNKSEIIQQTADKLSDEGDTEAQEKARRYIAKALDEGPQVFEWRAKKKNGEIFIVEVSLRCTNIGGVQQALAVVRDISERKRMEQRIAENEERYRTLVETSHDGISLMDLNGVMLFVNNRKIEMVGAKNPTDLVGQNAFSLLTPEGFDAVSTLMPTIIEKGFIDNLQTEVLRLDGSKFFAEFNVVVLKDANGNPKYLMDTMRDITARKKAEDELIRQTNFISSLLNAIPIPVYFKDKRGIFRGCNQSFSNFTGVSLENIVGKTSYQLWPNENSKKHHNNDIDLIKKPALQIEENTIIDKFGQTKDILIARNIYCDETEAVSGAIGAFIDITEQKQNTAQLENYKNHLEQLVKDRTEELETTNEELKTTNDELYGQREELEATITKLQNAQNLLIQSEKMASLGLLTADIAHDINNPLNFINGGALAIEYYVNENLTEHSQQLNPMIDAINEGVKRAAEVIQSLSRYNRKNDLPQTECDIHFIINNCLVMLKNQTKYSVEIIKKYCEDDLILTSNESKLHQAILNILSNAIQSISDKGTITIETSKNKEYLTVKISDTGCGISDEILLKITDPFFTTKEPGKGTGLGLSITQNIVDELKGNLMFESKPGKGTSVTIKLPLNKNDHQ